MVKNKRLNDRGEPPTPRPLNGKCHKFFDYFFLDYLDNLPITVQFSVLEISKTVKVNVIWIKVAPVLEYKVQKLHWWWDICHNKVEIFAKLRLTHFVQWQQRILTFWANMIIAGPGSSQINSLTVYKCRPNNSLPQQLQNICICIISSPEGLLQ